MTSTCMECRSSLFCPLVVNNIILAIIKKDRDLSRPLFENY